jgi:hypothetical protein
VYGLGTGGASWIGLLGKAVKWVWGDGRGGGIGNRDTAGSQLVLDRYL